MAENKASLVGELEVAPPDSITHPDAMTARVGEDSPPDLEPPEGEVDTDDRNNCRETAEAVLHDLIQDVADLIAATKLDPSSPESNLDLETERQRQEEEDKEIDEIFMGKVSSPRDAELEKVVNIRLDEMGNYLPPTPSATASTRSPSLTDEMDVDHYHESSACAADTSDLTNALLLMNILIEENRSLQGQLGKYKRVLAYVMSKYRTSMTFLLNELAVYQKDFQKVVKTLEEKANAFDSESELLKRDQQVEQMKHVMYTAAQLEDETANQYEKKITELQTQNQGLQKLVRISLDYGGHRLLSYQEKETQTTTIISEPTSHENLLGLMGSLEDTKEDNLDLLLAALDSKLEEDLDESFHTADSQEEDGEERELEEESIDQGHFSSGVGDQDKVEFDADAVNSAIFDAVSKTST